MRSNLAKRLLSNVRFSAAGMVPLCVAMIMISLTGLIILDYLFETYGRSSLPVVVLASLIVAATIFVSYLQGKRICARNRAACGAEEEIVKLARGGLVGPADSVP